MLTGREAVIRLLDLGRKSLLGVEGEGDTVTVIVLDGDEERRVTPTVGPNNLTPAPVKPYYPPPPADLAESAARELGLPLYLSREWMLRMLWDHKTTEKIAAASGYHVDKVEHYRRAHRINATEEVIRSRWMTGKYRRQRELAAELGLSAAAVSRVVGDARNVELDLRIRELLGEGLQVGEVADRLQAEGSRKTRERLIRQIRSAQTRQKTPEM